MIVEIALALSGLTLLLVILVLVKLGKRENGADFEKEFARLQSSLQAMFTASNDGQARLLSQSAQAQDVRLEALERTMSTRLLENANRTEMIRDAVEQKLSAIQQDNAKKLEQMRMTVDEKLQSTLEARIAQSFKRVSEQLEAVYKGLGEMQSLATGVGDLKKLLSGSKTRGILGEQQLAAILEQIMAPEQYAENVTTTGTAERVEFAVRLPGEGDAPVWLPIDAKFPIDPYNRLLEAYETGGDTSVPAAELRAMLKKSAKDIKDKYIAPPMTTDFAVLFLPSEGLYAEVLRLNIAAELQAAHKIIIAGPTTMAALLNSLQMGFRTLAIQKRSGEVWTKLGEVKSEFENFNIILTKAQDKLRQTGDELEKLIGVRSRAIERKLRGIEHLPEGDVPLELM